MAKFYNSIDVNVETRLGNLPNRRMVTIIGHTEAASTAVNTVMPGTASIDPSAIIATPATVKVASTSANDTSAGTGARTIRLYGLDANGVEQSETITLNGQTEVTSANTYKFVHGTTVLTAGSGGINAGVIWVGNGVFTAGVPATKLCSTEAGKNQSQLGAYMIPAGYKFVPTQLVMARGDASSGRFLEVNVMLRSPVTGLYSEAYSVHAPSGSHVQRIEAFPVQNAGTVVELRALVSVGTAAVTTAVAGYLVLDA